VNEGGYDPYEAPPSPNPGQPRFALLSRTPAGHGNPLTGDAGTVAYNALKFADDRVQAAQANPIQNRYPLKAVLFDGEGYSLVARGAVEGHLTVQPHRPSKLWKQLKAGELIDSFLMGSDAYRSAPDSEVYDALLAVCEAERITAEGLRQLNIAVAITLAVRVGFVVLPENLPNPGTASE
jgi:hypothetical protein